MIRNQFHPSIYHFSEFLRLYSNHDQRSTGGQDTSATGYHEIVAQFNSADRRDRAIHKNQIILSRHPENPAALRRLIIAHSINGEYSQAFRQVGIDTSPENRRKDIVRGYAAWKPVS